MTHRINYSEDENFPVMKNDPLKPSVALLSKLGSIAVHLEEFMSTDGHVFDHVSLQQLLKDSEVKEWLNQMDKTGLVPKKRNDRDLEKDKRFLLRYGKKGKL